MEYTVQKLAKIAGVSARTIRYYDEIGILKPSRINSSGYRVYGQAEVNQLQQVLFYRTLGVRLEVIKDILTAPSFDTLTALKEHHQKLLDRKQQLDLLIANVVKTIASTEGRVTMSDTEKFAGFKRKLIDENEEKYGEEIRTKYGEEAVNHSNQKVLNMTEEQYGEFEKLSASVIETLKQAFATSDPGSDLAQKAVELHRQWLSFTWKSYSKEAHVGLAQMYTDDERFTAYYDQHQPGLTKFLRDAVIIYVGNKENFE